MKQAQEKHVDSSTEVLGTQVLVVSGGRDNYTNVRGYIAERRNTNCELGIQSDPEQGSWLKTDISATCICIEIRCGDTLEERLNYIGSSPARRPLKEPYLQINLSPF